MLSSSGACHYYETISLYSVNEKGTEYYECWKENDILYCKGTGKSSQYKTYYHTVNGVQWVYQYDYYTGSWSKTKNGTIDKNGIDFFDKNNYNKISKNYYELKETLDAGQYQNVTIEKINKTIIVTYYISFSGWECVDEIKYIDFDGGYGLTLPNV